MGCGMNREQITALAVEAWGEGHEIFWFDDDGLERFAALAYAAGQRDMREKAAELCDDVEDDEFYCGSQYADAIRALPIEGEKE